MVSIGKTLRDYLEIESVDEFGCIVNTEEIVRVMHITEIHSRESNGSYVVKITLKIVLH